LARSLNAGEPAAERIARPLHPDAFFLATIWPWA
jgi:hypothetical protein